MAMAAKVTKSTNPVDKHELITAESSHVAEARRRFELAHEVSSPAMQQTLLEARGAAQAKLVDEILDGLSVQEVHRLRKRLQQREVSKR